MMRMFVDYIATKEGHGLGAASAIVAGTP